MMGCTSAPIADSESDSISDNEKSNSKLISEVTIRRSYSDPLDISLESTISLSLEDLISSFDEQIYKCFQDLDVDTTKIAPVCAKRELINESDWWSLSWSDEKERRISESKSIKDDRYAASTNSHNRLSFGYMGHDSPSLRSTEGLLLEIHEMMDYSDNNADFEGIAESFYDSDLSESVKDAVVNFQDTWSNKEGSNDWQKALDGLSVDALKLIINDMKARIRTLSDCLLIHLVSRDELDFEREIRDRFMLLLQGVQRKKKEFARTLITQRHNAVQLRQKNRGPNRWSWNGNWGTLFRNKNMKTADHGLNISNVETKDLENNNNDISFNTSEFSQGFVQKQSKTTKFMYSEDLSNCNSGSFRCSKSKVERKSQSLDQTLKYLSTTIPFNPGVSAINVHHLQIFNKILLAILQENSKLDDFLTEYILNIYTPSFDSNDKVYPNMDNCNNYPVDVVCQ